MANTILANDRLQVKVYCHDNEQASVNTFYFLATATAGGSLTDKQVASILDADVAPLWKPLMNNGASYDGVSVRIANQLPLPVAQFANTHAGIGTGGAVGLPKQTAGILSLRTNKAGPGFRGRLYLPFPSTDDNHFAGLPTTGYVGKLTDIATWMEATVSFVVGGANVSVDACVWSKKHNVLTPIDTWLSEAFWATQKRRGSFGRPNSSPF